MVWFSDETGLVTEAFLSHGDVACLPASVAFFDIPTAFGFGLTFPRVALTALMDTVELSLRLGDRGVLVALPGFHVVFACNDFVALPAVAFGATSANPDLTAEMCSFVRCDGLDGAQVAGLGPSLLDVQEAMEFGACENTGGSACLVGKGFTDVVFTAFVPGTPIAPSTFGAVFEGVHETGLFWNP